MAKIKYLDEVGLGIIKDEVNNMIPSELPANGGNADTVNSIRIGSNYRDIFSTSLTYNHSCWNKKVYVSGQSSDSSANYYIENAPEVSTALWYEVETVGNTAGSSRAYQIAIGCYNHQKKTIFIRTMHDDIWSEWQNLRDDINADTVDGLHADDFVKSGKEQIEIPSDADVPIWIRNNAKRYTVYCTVGASNGYTNLPNNSTDYVWYIYNGNFIFAYINSEHRLYVCDTINGVFSGWQALFTTRHMPYVTGTVTVARNNIASVSLGFIPDCVLYAKVGNGIISPNVCVAIGENVDYDWFRGEFDVDDVVWYMAFKPK